VARNGQFGRLAKSAGFRRNPQEHAGTGAIRQEKNPTENGWGFIIGGGWLTMCGLASRAYEHWRGLLRASANYPEFPDSSNYQKDSATPQPNRHIPERGQCRFEMLNDLLLQHIRRRQIVEVVQAVVLEPKDIETGLVAGH